jgi:hypothetical protein
LVAVWTEELETSYQIRWKNEGLDKITLSGAWEPSSLRFRWKSEFTDSAFYKARLEWRYRERPWKWELKLTLEESEPCTWECIGSYDSDELQANAAFTFRGPFEFNKVALSLGLSPTAKWDMKLSLKLTADGPLPTLTALLEGDLDIGQLTMEWQNFHLHSLKLVRFWEMDTWEHELTWQWTEESGFKLDGESFCSITDSSGWGVEFTLYGFASPKLTYLRLFRFGESWKLSLDAVKQKLRSQFRREITPEAALSWDISLSASGIDGELWVDLYLGEVELTFGVSLWEDSLVELYLELYLEF